MNPKPEPQKILHLFNQLTIFIVLCLAAVDVFAKTSLSIADLKKNEKIDVIFTRLCKAEKFSGAALIAINGTIIFKKACGIANRDFNFSNTIKTKFTLASVGKLFTSVAIAQLIAKNQLSLDTPVYKIVPSWLPMPNAKAITIGQLLIHTSGLGNYMDDKRWQLGADSSLYVTTTDHKSLVAEKGLLFMPGTSQSYSNSGYLILGAIIEKISGEWYSDYLNKHIFNQVKMFDTGLYPLDAVIENRAIGYFQTCKDKKCQWKNNEFSAPFIGTAAGGAYSTVDDIFNFSQALYHSTLLPRDMTERLLSIRLAEPYTHKDFYHRSYTIGGVSILEKMSPYGFSGAWNPFGLALWHEPNLLGHTGGNKGAAALLVMSPDNKYTIIILSNLDNGTSLLYQQIREALGFQGSIENF